MSLPRSSRSINRRLPPVRSLTLPTSTSTTTTRTTTTTTTASTLQESPSSSYTEIKDIESFLPSIDESLQDWLTRNVPDTTHSPSLFYSLLEDPCPCCKKLNCEHLETLYKSIRKLEMDARLAAEIGQSLLHKHEALITETNRTKEVLEKQVNECHEKIATLEQLLIDTDNSKLEMMEQRDQSIRKWQKTEQALQDTSIELEKANERCLELGNELKNKTKEVEKLRVFKTMARQADYHEDVLRSQLEDTNQELAITRKNELMLESKYKQLKSRYEMVCSSYEKLKLNDSAVGQNTNYQVNTLKESNEKLRNDIIKLTSLIPNTQYELNDKQPEQAYMISLIKELALANTKLRMELINKDNSELYNINDPISQESDILMSDNDCVSKTFMDGYNNEGGLFHHDTKLEDTILSCNNTLIDDNNNNNIPQQQSSSSTKVINTDLNNNNSNNSNNNNSNNNNNNENHHHHDNNDDTLVDSPIPSPSTSSSPIKSEVVHYHFHYHLKNKKRQLAKKNDYAKASKNKTTLSNYDTIISPSSDITSELDPPSSITMVSKDTPVTCKDCKDDSPYHKLQLNVSHYLDRLKSTDICSLNRRLRRTFDMMELSNMSNSIIENILLDIKTIQDHFAWVKEQYNYDSDDNNGNDDDNDQQQQSIFISAFYPTLHLFQFLLTEIGELRMAMNHLQVDYVKKVEEMDIFVKEDILRKQNENVKQQLSLSTTTITNRSSSSSTRTINKNNNNSDNHNHNDHHNNTHTSIATTGTANERMVNNSTNSNGSTNNNKSAFSWLSNVFQIQTQNTSSSTTTPSASISSETRHYKVRYQRSCDSISTSKFRGGDNNTDNAINNNNNNKFPIMTTSCSLRVQQKRNDMDKFGPPSSFPRAIHINDPKNKRRRSTSIHTKSMIYPLKPSQSTGPKSSSSSSSFSASTAAGIGWPPTTSSSCLTEEVAIQRKRSLLGLGSSNTNNNHHHHTVSDPIDKVNAVDWKLGTSYGSSWLGSNF